MSSSVSTKFSEMDFETSYDESKDTDFSPKHESIDVAHELLKDGKVSLENESIPAAIEELSDACDIFASVFGESAPECAEAFYFYGKALLAMSRIESMVLDNAFEGVDIEEDSTEGEQVEGTTAMTKDEKLEIEDAVTDAFEDNYDEHDRVARAHVFEDSEGSEASDSDDSDGFPLSPFLGKVPSPAGASEHLLAVPGWKRSRNALLPPLSPFLPAAAGSLAGPDDEARTPILPHTTLASHTALSGHSSSLDLTSSHRKTYLGSLLAVLTDGLLPLLSLIFSAYNTAELFLVDTSYGWLGLGLFCLPSVLVLLFYVENMRHRSNLLLEVVLIVLLGPFLRWLCSARLLLLKLNSSDRELPAGSKDLQAFATATRVIDGVFQGSVQMIWLLYLIAIEIYPFPMLEYRTTTVTDWSGNSVEVPLFSSFGLYTALAVLVKNLMQLWLLHFPVCTERDGSSTVLVHQPPVSLARLLFQWLLLLMFVLFSSIFRLASYTLLLIHLNFFLLPTAAIIFFSLLLHIVLRGVSNHFYVPTSNMDILLTASCCCLVPTPVNSNIRAHNLLQVHSVVTNLLLLVSLVAAVFLSLDYSLPMVWRPDRVAYSAEFFYNLCLATSLLLPLSTTCYWLYKRERRLPGMSRRTLFWRGSSPPPLAAVVATLSTVLVLAVGLLTLLGGYSSGQCHPPTVRHGLYRTLPHGGRLECHPNYTPVPQGRIICTWFFGRLGFVSLSPFYNENKIADKIHHLHSLSSLACLPRPATLQDCNSTQPTLPGSPETEGKWICLGESCSLFCRPGFHPSNLDHVNCSVTSATSQPRARCSLVSLALDKSSSQLLESSSLNSPQNSSQNSSKNNSSKLVAPSSCPCPELVSLPPPEDLVLCLGPEDLLLQEGQCCCPYKPTSHTSCNFNSSILDQHFKCSATPAQRLLFPDLPKEFKNLLAHDSEPPTSHLVTAEGECAVQLHYSAVLVVGFRSLLAVFTHHGLRYHQLPSDKKSENVLLARRKISSEAA